MGLALALVAVAALLVASACLRALLLRRRVYAYRQGLIDDAERYLREVMRLGPPPEVFEREVDAAIVQLDLLLLGAARIPVWTLALRPWLPWDVRFVAYPVWDAQAAVGNETPGAFDPGRPVG